jgi:hypothetical protein
MEWPTLKLFTWRGICLAQFKNCVALKSRRNFVDTLYSHLKSRNQYFEILHLVLPDTLTVSCSGVEVCAWVYSQTHLYHSLLCFLLLLAVADGPDGWHYFSRYDCQWYSVTEHGLVGGQTLEQILHGPRFYHLLLPSGEFACVGSDCDAVISGVHTLDITHSDD